MPEPLVSVVVPTHDRPARLARLLEALRGQTLEPAQFEVIVVAEPTPDTIALLEREQARGDLDLQVVERLLPIGPGAARNLGWRSARGDLVAFTDDDCRPTSPWLEEGLAAWQGRLVIQGRTEPDPSESGNDGLLSRSMRVESLGPQYETCNIFYPRALLERLGGFDEGYGPGGEDTDLAWRAIEAGYETAFAPDALVHHAVERLGVSGMLRFAARWTGPMRVFARHPETRSMLYRGWFWNVWHYLLWRSVAALLGPRWLRQLVITLHLMQLRRRAREAGAGGWAVPFLLVYDLVECWAVARGGLRYRTLVL